VKFYSKIKPIYAKKLNFNLKESTITRSPKPTKVLYRVGQVIKHKRLNIRGVIIGWDDACKAPDEWIERNYSEEEVNTCMVIKLI